MSNAKTRNAKARKVLTTICKAIGYPTNKVKKLDDEWYILHLGLRGTNSIIQLETGGMGSTTLYWEVVYGPSDSGSLSFADAVKAPFIQQLKTLAKTLREAA